MKSTFNYSFLCRPSKIGKNALGLAPVEISLIINGQRTYIQTQLKCKPDEFSKALKGKGFPEIQNFLSQTRTKILELQNDMMANGIPMTAAILKEYFKNGCVKQTYLLKDLKEEYLKLLSKRVGVDLSDVSYKRYIKSINLFYELNELSEEQPAAIVNMSHFVNFRAELYKRMAVDSAANYIKKARAFFIYAFECGKIPSNPSYGIKVARGNAESVKYLTQDELNKIRAYHFQSERLQRIADCFIFSCYTGLAYSDMKELEPDDFKKNDMNQIFIEKKRVKTGIKFCTILLEDAISIARKYDYKLPVVSNQKMNAYLLEISTICDLPKITSHTARHTFVAYLLNYRPAIPQETIIKACGWNSEQQLRNYAKLFNITLFSDFKKVQNRNTLNKILKKEGAV